MDKEKKHAAEEPRKANLVFHIRRLRQWYRDKALSQTELSRLAGVPTRSLRSLESARSIPRAVESLLRVSLALGVSVEKLIDPIRREGVAAGVVCAPEKQLSSDGGVEAEPRKHTHSYNPILSACHRGKYLAVAVCNGVDVLEVVRARMHRGDSLKTVVGRIIADYGCGTILVEPNRPLFKEVQSLQCSVRTLALTEAKERLLPGRATVTHRDLYQHLVESDPRLRRFVTVLPATGRVAMTERWRTVNLLAVALGRAYACQAVSASPEE